MAEHNKQQKLWTKIVAKAWTDEGYKQRLLDDPNSVMSEEGIKIPEGVEFKCVEDTERQVWLVIPPNPDGSINTELDDAQLNEVSAGAGDPSNTSPVREPNISEKYTYKWT